MSYHSRRILTPGSSRKRKEMEVFYSVKPSTPPPSLTQPLPTHAAEPISSNRLLAGYMAYEFLTKGTLLGQKFDAARAEALPLSVAEPSTRSEPDKPRQSYTEVAGLLKMDGAHVAGIVNPTQLARWIQM